MDFNIGKNISTVVFLVKFPRVLLTVARTSGQLLYEGFSPSLVAASGGYVWRTREIWPIRPLLGFLFRFVCLKNKANCNFCLKKQCTHQNLMASRCFGSGRRQSVKPSRARRRTRVGDAENNTTRVRRRAWLGFTDST